MSVQMTVAYVIQAKRRFSATPHAGATTRHLAISVSHLSHDASCTTSPRPYRVAQFRYSTTQFDYHYSSWSQYRPKSSTPHSLTSLLATQFSASIPPLIYALLGTSRQLNVAPEAALSLLVGQAISDVLHGDPHSHPEHVDAIGLAVSSVIVVQVSHYPCGDDQEQQSDEILSHSVVG